MADIGAWVVGVGMVTPVGASAVQTLTSVRAGISRYNASSFYNRHFRPMTMSLVPDDALSPLAPPLEAALGLTARQARMLRLATPAIHEAAEKARTKLALPLFLGVPEQLPNRPLPVSEEFLDHLIVQADVRIDRVRSRIFALGRASGTYALEAALNLFAGGRDDFVLVGGVDTFLDLYLLSLLDSEDRVLADGVVDGFAPGEGSAFLLLGSDRVRPAVSPKPSIKVFPPGLAGEPGHRYSAQPYKGEGLAEAVALSLTHAKPGKIRSVFASLNGENFGAKEWGVAFLRSKALFDEALELYHPAEFYGDPGAACAPLLMGLTALGLEAGHVEGPSLVWCASDLESRGAIVVARSTEEA